MLVSLFKVFALVATTSLAIPMASGAATTSIKSCQRKNRAVSSSAASGSSRSIASSSVIGNNNAAVTPSSISRSSSIRAVSSSKPASTRASSSTKATSSSKAASASSSKAASTSKPASTSVKPSSTPSGGSTAPSGDLANLLQLHNDFRRQYNASNLVWDDTVAAYAKEQASKCKFAHSNGPYGENLAAGVGGGYTAASGFKGWADEASQYDYNNPGFSSATGHFTQVVWKGTSKLGCAVVNCPAGSIFGAQYQADNILVWCNYQAPGNYQGQFPANVNRKIA